MFYFFVYGKVSDVWLSWLGFDSSYPSMILNWDDLRLHMYQLFMGASIDFFSGWKWIQISRPAFFFPGTCTKPVSKLRVGTIAISVMKVLQSWHMFHRLGGSALSELDF